MKTARWMVLGVMLGFLASSAASCGDPPAKCGPQSCPSGCCDAAGTCQVGSADAQCGAGGRACLSCGIGERCDLGACAVIPSTGGGSGQDGGGTTGGGGGTTGGGGGAMGGGAGTGGGAMGGGDGTGGGDATGGGGGAMGPDGGETGPDGGAICTGCFNGATCVPLASTDVSACGRNAATCQPCGPSMSCIAGVCMTVNAPDAGLTFGNARVRLVNGNGTSNGRLEAFVGGAFGQVCVDYFDQNAVDVVCRDLGFTTGTLSRTIGPSNIFVMDDVQCTGAEMTIQMCSYIGSSGEDCLASSAVFLECM